MHPPIKQYEAKLTTGLIKEKLTGEGLDSTYRKHELDSQNDDANGAPRNTNNIMKSKCNTWFAPVIPARDSNSELPMTTTTT
jgi:hypothetical protein